MSKNNKQQEEIQLTHKAFAAWLKKQTRAFGANGYWVRPSITGKLLNGFDYGEPDFRIDVYEVTGTGKPAFGYGKTGNDTIAFAALVGGGTVPEAWIAHNARLFTQRHKDFNPWDSMTEDEYTSDFSTMYKLGMDLYLDRRNVMTGQKLPEVNVDHIDLDDDSRFDKEQVEIQEGKPDKNGLKVIETKSGFEFGLILAQADNTVPRVQIGKYQIPIFAYGLKEQEPQIRQQFKQLVDQWQGVNLVGMDF